MRNQTINVNKNNVNDAREKLNAALAEMKQEQDAYEKEWGKLCDEADKSGQPQPAYNPPEIPSIVLSCDISCMRCGKKCGSLDFSFQKGIDAAVEEVERHETLCDKHSSNPE